MESVRVYLGLGSNLGDRLANLERGLQVLGKRVRLVKVSSIYETEPWGFVKQPAFLNCVVEGISTVSPGGLLEILKETERLVGREDYFPRGAAGLRRGLVILRRPDCGLAPSESAASADTGAGLCARAYGGDCG